jgi:hypothetical protein
MSVLATCRPLRVVESPDFVDKNESSPTVSSRTADRRIAVIARYVSESEVDSC